MLNNDIFMNNIPELPFYIIVWSCELLWKHDWINFPVYALCRGSFLRRHLSFPVGLCGLSASNVSTSGLGYPASGPLKFL